MVDTDILSRIHEDPHHIDVSWRLRLTPIADSLCASFSTTFSPSRGVLTRFNQWLGQPLIPSLGAYR